MANAYVGQNGNLRAVAEDYLLLHGIAKYIVKRKTQGGTFAVMTISNYINSKKIIENIFKTILYDLLNLGALLGKIFGAHVPSLASIRSTKDFASKLTHVFKST